MSSVSYVLAALSVFVITPLWSQITPDPALTRVRSGEVVRIRMQDGRLSEGRLSFASLSEATLQTPERNRSFSTTSVDSLWIRGNGAGTGAVIGAIALGVPSIFVWKAFCDLGNEGTGCRGGDLLAVAALSALTAGAGAGVGALIGSAVPQWKLRYARPRMVLSVGPNSLKGVAFVISLTR